VKFDDHTNSTPDDPTSTAKPSGKAPILVMKTQANKMHKEILAQRTIFDVEINV
jgi:hypothetical protein